MAAQDRLGMFSLQCVLERLGHSMGLVVLLIVYFSYPCIELPFMRRRENAQH